MKELDVLWFDVARAVRSLHQSALVVGACLLSIGLGVGAPMAFYSVIDAVFLHDVTARDAAQLTRLGPLSYSDFREVRDSDVFETVAAAYQLYPALRWRDGNQPRALMADVLSANFFETVGGRAVVGRVFTAVEASPEKDPRVVILGYRFWKNRFNADPRVVGRTLTLNDAPFTIIGVLSSDYRAIQGFGIDPDVYIPMSATAQPELFGPGTAVMSPIGRLRAGRSLEQTRQALATVLSRLRQRAAPAMDMGGTGGPAAPPQLVPVSGLAKFGRTPFERSVLTFSGILAAVIGLLLVLACANVAGLLLMRGVTRQRELAVRASIGASGWQLVQQMLVEASVVAALGAASGIVLAIGIAQILSRVEVPVQDVTVRFAFALDWRFGAVAIAVAVATTVLTGVPPAIAATRVDLTSSLRATQATIAPRLRLGSWLVSAQIAVSVVLLSASFLFIRNVVNVLGRPPGFDVDRVVWLDLATERGVGVPQQIVRRDRLRRALESAPGVESVSWAWYLPFQLAYPEPTLRSASGSTVIRPIEQGIGPGYLRTVGIPLVRGRDFDANDLVPRNPGTPVPVIINEAFARRYFGGIDVVGERLVRLAPARQSPPMIVIGVSADTDFRQPGEAPVPLLQSLNPLSPSFVVRVRGGAATAAPVLSRAIDTVAPGALIGSFTGRTRLERAQWADRAAAILLATLGAIGLLIAAVGLVALSLYNAARRSTEMGIRVALGATRRQIVVAMLSEGVRLVGVGAVIGMIGAFVLGRSLRAFLSGGIASNDPLALSGTILTLLLAATAALWTSARRAANADPLRLLRSG